MIVADNVTVTTIERASRGKSDQYGQPLYVPWHENVRARFEARQRIRRNLDGTEAQIDGTLDVSPHIDILPGDRVSLTFGWDRTFRVFDVEPGLDIVGNLVFNTCLLTELR